jgi:ribosome maturation factor RimP
LDQNGQIEKTVEALLAGPGIELVGVEIVGSRGNPTVRVFVDKPGGVSVEDCARVSRALQDQFDAAGLLPGRYVLEVSSPGIDRPLRRPEDFERFSGETAQVQTYEKIGGRHRHTGLLDGYDREKQTVTLTDDSGTRVVIPLGAIKKANLKRDPWARAQKK